MSTKKNDLTRIEDLGEFFHNDDDSFENTESETESKSDLNQDFFSANEEVINGASTIFEDQVSNEAHATFQDTESDFGTDFLPENQATTDTTSLPFEDSPTEDSLWSNEETNKNFSFSSDSDKPLTSDLYIKPESKTLVSSTEHNTESTKNYQGPETFEDLKNFSEQSQFNQTQVEANPAFSLLLKDVRYIEDIQDIIIILNELNLLTESEEKIKERLMRGSLLIPRISEFTAIFLAHKLRRLDLDMHIGLSDQIHPPKDGSYQETAIVSKKNLFQNQSHSYQFNQDISIKEIIVATTPALENYQITHYLGVATEHKILDAIVVENENSEEILGHYQELSMRLKGQALKAKSNAIVGVNFQISPVINDYGESARRYRLTCTGSMVWVTKI